MGKILGLIIKIFLIIVGIFLLYCLTFGRDFGLKQVHKMMGMYYVHVGDDAYRAHNMQEAVNAYQQGLNLFPSHYEAWLNLGNIYVAYEDYYSASQAYQNAIMAKDNYTLARMNLGIITAEKLGDFDSAIEQYEEIIDAKHILINIPYVYNNKTSETANKAIAYYNMGRAYAQKAFYTPIEQKAKKKELLGKALAAYEQANSIKPNDYDIIYNLALTYHLLGDYRKAGQNYCSAINAEPMHYESHYNLGLMLRHLKQHKYAIDELEKATVLSTGKNSTHTQYIFGILGEVTSEAISRDENSIKDKIKLTEETEKEPPIILINGKITPTDEGDTVIIESFRKCRSKELFEN